MTPAAAGTSIESQPIEIETGQGLARVHLKRVANARGALVLGHGAGGGVSAPDLLAATAAAVARGLSVALVEQPYRVAGRRSAPPAPRLDAAWIDVVNRLGQEAIGGPPLVLGGRSSGARVACRTAAALSAVGVVCLAFPLLPPQRANASQPPRSRLDELEGVPVPVLVVQGRRDRFGMPPAADGRTVVEVAGDHSLRSDGGAVQSAVSDWVATLLGVGQGAQRD
jgi:predicted alpha/beta-hydrolase family hydrolase